jgi:hypothetical protein
MKKKPVVADRGNDLRQEYNLWQIKSGVRGKYYRQATAGTNLVLIEPEYSVTVLRNPDRAVGLIRRKLQYAVFLVDSGEKSRMGEAPHGSHAAESEIEIRPVFTPNDLGEEFTPERRKRSGRGADPREEIIVRGCRFPGRSLDVLIKPGFPPGSNGR